MCVHPSHKENGTVSMLTPRRTLIKLSLLGNTGSSRLNSTYLRIAQQAGIASTPPLSCPVSQESRRKCKRSARESTVICNQGAGFNHCLLKIQQNMQSQLKAIHVESKGKTPTKVSSAVDKLQFLLDFNSSVCQAMVKSMSTWPMQP